MSLHNPVPSGRYTDGFGPRGYVPGLGSLGYHTGRDIAATAGTPILAAHDGTVIRKWWDAFASGAGAGGWMVAIRGDDGYESRYAHMQTASPLTIGQRVTGGQTVVGRLGMSGAATGPHLHFEVLSGGRYIDPDPLIAAAPPAAPIPTPITKTLEDQEMRLIMYRHGGGKNRPRWLVFGAPRRLVLETQKAANDWAKNQPQPTVICDSEAAWKKYLRAAGPA